MKNIVNIFNPVQSQFDQFKKEDLYQKILADFSNHCEEMRENNMFYIQNEMEKLKNFRNKILSSRDIENHDMASEPVDQNEIFSVMTNDKFEKFKTVINSKTDVKHAIVNNKYSNLGRDNLVRKTLDCIKGERIVPPTQKFLEVRDIGINDVDLAELEHAKNIYDINKAFEAFKEENEGLVLSQYHKSVRQDKNIFEDLLNRATNKLDKMDKDVKMSEEILKYVKDKLNDEFNKDVIRMGIDRLNLCDNNLDLINKQLKSEDIALKRDRLHLLIENNKKALENADKYFKDEKEDKVDVIAKMFESNELTDSKIDNLYNKYKSKAKKKESKFTFSSAPVSMSYIQKKAVRSTTNMKFKKKYT